MGLAPGLLCPLESLTRLGDRGLVSLRALGLTLLAVLFSVRYVDTATFLYFNTLCGLAFALLFGSTLLGSRETPWRRALARCV